MYRPKKIFTIAFIYIVLINYTIIAIYPIFLMITTAFKENKEIFMNPYALPQSWDFSNLVKLFKISNYAVYFQNRIVIAVVSIFLILIISSLSSYVISKY